MATTYPAKRYSRPARESGLFPSAFSTLLALALSFAVVIDCHAGDRAPSQEKRPSQSEGAARTLALLLWTVPPLLAFGLALTPYLLVSRRLKRLQLGRLAQDADLVATIDQTSRDLARARHEHREAGERLRAVFMITTEAHVEIDDGGQIVEWSHSAEKLMGWARDDAIGLALNALLTSTAPEQPTQAAIEAGWSMTSDQPVEMIVFHKSGKEIVTDVSSASIKIEGAKRTLVLLKDVSARRNAESRLEEADRWLRHITDAMPAVIASFDAQERCTFSNGLARKILGVGPGDHGSSALRCAMGALYEANRPALSRALCGTPVLFEGQIKIYGTPVDFKFHCVPNRTAKGEIIGMSIVAQDQIALKNAERASAAGEHRLRTITDNMPVLIAYIDRQERYQFCNATYTAWSGLVPDQVIGRRMAEIMRPEEYAQRSVQFQRTLAGERTEFDIETNWIGISRHLHTIYLPDRAPDGSVNGAYVLVTDVTAMKNAEVQLELQARTDTLTGLPNRHAFNESLADALTRSRRSERPIALLFLDIDKFKFINDTFGHSAGDDVLKIFAQRLKTCVRERDMVARLAGDEFIIVLENLASVAGPEGIACKIIASMSKPFGIDGQSLDITTSIGIAYQSDGNTLPALLLASADKALYEAKDQGRNTFRIVKA